MSLALKTQRYKALLFAIVNALYGVVCMVLLSSQYHNTSMCYNTPCFCQVLKFHLQYSV